MLRSGTASYRYETLRNGRAGRGAAQQRQCKEENGFAKAWRSKAQTSNGMARKSLEEQRHRVARSRKAKALSCEVAHCEGKAKLRPEE